MSIVRSPRPQASFTILENSVLRDRRLSLRARGLLALLLSFPDNWRTSSEHLARLGPDGRDAIRTTLAELERAGYLIRRRAQDPQTGRWSTETTVFDTPRELSPDNPQPTPDSPAPVDPALIEVLREEVLTNSSSSTNSRWNRGACGNCGGSGWETTGLEAERCMACEVDP